MAIFVFLSFFLLYLASAKCIILSGVEEDSTIFEVLGAVRSVDCARVSFAPSILKAIYRFYARHVGEYKYFSEIGGCGHYDARYFKRFLSLGEIQPVLKELFREWHAFSQGRNVTYFLAHGTLLGWWWGRQILPWDTDLDLQMTMAEMTDLYNNNSQRNFRSVGTGGAYSLEFNLNFKSAVLSYANVIDMRFIHKPSGLFIDITNLFPVAHPEVRLKLLAAGLQFDRYYMDKKPHYYEVNDLLPLREANFEGVNVFVPHNVKKVLREEYGDDALDPVRGSLFKYLRNSTYRFIREDSFQDAKNGFLGRWFKHENDTASPPEPLTKGHKDWKNWDNQFCNGRNKLACYPHNSQPCFDFSDTVTA